MLARLSRSEVGLYQLRVLANLLGGVLGDLLAVVQHRYPVGDAHHDPHLVFDQEHGYPPLRVPGRLKKDPRMLLLRRVCIPESTFSRALMVSNSRMFWNVRPMSICALLCAL